MTDQSEHQQVQAVRWITIHLFGILIEMVLGRMASISRPDWHKPLLLSCVDNWPAHLVWTPELDGTQSDACSLWCQRVQVPPAQWPGEPSSGRAIPRSSPRPAKLRSHTAWAFQHSLLPHNAQGQWGGAVSSAGDDASASFSQHEVPSQGHCGLCAGLQWQICARCVQVSIARITCSATFSSPSHTFPLVCSLSAWSHGIWFTQLDIWFICLVSGSLAQCMVLWLGIHFSDSVSGSLTHLVSGSLTWYLIHSVSLHQARVLNLWRFLPCCVTQCTCMSNKTNDPWGSCCGYSQHAESSGRKSSTTMYNPPQPLSYPLFCFVLSQLF